MNKAVFITVRSASTRLPGKAKLLLGGIPTIQWVMERAKCVKNADKVILCTTHLPEDDWLADLARSLQIDVVRGSVKDKLDRWLQATKEHEVDFFVTADGDDLFCDPTLMDLGFEQFSKSNADMIEGLDVVVCGGFTYGIKTAALRSVCELKNTDDTEMMWVYFKETGRFKVEPLKGFDPLLARPEYRMTLDYQEDLDFFRAVVKALKKSPQDLSLKEIVGFLNENPSIVKINQDMAQIWKQNQLNKTSLVLKEETL